jgi:hypothetical protein
VFDAAVLLVMLKVLLVVAARVSVSLKYVVLMALPLESLVALVAAPDKVAVIVPALKLPLASRFTIVEAVLLFVAVIQPGMPLEVVSNT